MNGTELVLDLIVTEDGIPKIVEFQNGGAYYGYQKAYGRGLNFKIWIDWTSREISRAEPPVLFSGISSNKALASSFAHSLCSDHTPRQKTFAYCPERSAQEDIKACFPEDQTLVVKIPYASNGHGVFFLDQQKFDFRGPLKNHARKHMRGFIGSGKSWGSILTGGWRKPVPHNGHIVIQECLSPRQISSGGEFYAPTIRAVMTVAWGGLASMTRPDIFIHGAYYKLPAKPVLNSKTLDPERLKSNVHGNKRSARIEPQDMELIQDTLPDTVRRVFRYCAEHSPRDLIMDTLEKGEAGDVVSAIVYASMLKNEATTLQEMTAFLADSRETLSAQTPFLYANLLKDVSSAPGRRLPAAKFEGFASRRPVTEPGEIISRIIGASFYRQEIQWP